MTGITLDPLQDCGQTKSYAQIFKVDVVSIKQNVSTLLSMNHLWKTKMKLKIHFVNNKQFHGFKNFYIKNNGFESIHLIVFTKS